MGSLQNPSTLYKENRDLEDRKFRLNVALGKIEDKLKHNDEVAAHIDEALVLMDKGIMPRFTYAYGKHTATSDEYCWLVPQNLKDSARVGATATVNTKFGPKSAIITRIEHSPYYFDHKTVISFD